MIKKIVIRLLVLLLCASQLSCVFKHPTKISANEVTFLVLHSTRPDLKVPDVKINDRKEITRIMSYVNNLIVTNREIKPRLAIGGIRIMIYTDDGSAYLSILYMTKEDIVLSSQDKNYLNNGLAEIVFKILSEQN